jgi:hypothetical protein
MKTKESLLLAASLIFAGNASAITVHFNSDFETAIDTSTSIIDSSGNLTQVFGDLSLSTFGSMNGTALVFNPNTNSYEQARLALGAGASFYHIEFDILTQGLVGSDYAFVMLADTPTVQNLSFSNCCSDSIQFGSSTLGVVTNDTLMHVIVDIDLVNSLWMADISGVGSATSTFNSSGGDVDALRFGLLPALGGAGIDTNVFVGIDNLLVTSVPVPAAFWLFASGGLGLFSLGRFKNKN